MCVSPSSLLAFLDRHAIHYSYFVLPVSSCFLIASGVGSTYATGFYSSVWNAHLSISRFQLGVAWAVALLLTSITIPFIGPLMDKMQMRQTAFVMILPLVGGLLWLSSISGLVELIFSLYLTRTATSCFIIISATQTNFWWIKRKGFAIAITNALGNLALLWPSVLSFFHHTLFADDWRAALRLEALAGGLLALMSAALTLNQPEKYNRKPDAMPQTSPLEERLFDGHEESNEDNSPSSSSSSSSSAEIHWTCSAAIRTRLFWSVNLSSFATGIFWSGYSFHFTSIIGESNIEATLGRSISDLLFIPITVSVIVGMIVAGRIYDRIVHKHYGMILGTSLCILAIVHLLLFAYAADSNNSSVCYLLLFSYAIIYGVFNAWQTLGSIVIFAFVFGRNHISTIFAASNLLMQSSMALGPILFGLSIDYLHSYTPVLVFTIMLGVCAIGLLAVTALPTAEDNRRIEQRLLNKRKGAGSGDDEDERARDGMMDGRGGSGADEDDYGMEYVNGYSSNSSPSFGRSIELVSQGAGASRADDE